MTMKYSNNVEGVQHISEKFSALDAAILAFQNEYEQGAKPTYFIGNAGIRIVTRVSRDPSRSNNGGDYYFWVDFWRRADGYIFSQRTSSCDFWQPDDHGPARIGRMSASEWAATKECVRLILESIVARALAVA
jgi:hypothetical protein